ncbi:hypothetical protein C0033_10520 [Clostridium sp. chh4-2]|nr:hypothetical protein C0033_10520 [Clostridium sp. chh4-2]
MNNNILIKKLKLISNFKGYFMQKKLQILFLFVSEIMLVGYLFINPLFYKYYIDKALLDKEINYLKYVICGQLLIFLIYTLILYLNKNIKFNLINSVLYKIRNDIFNSFLNFKESHFNKYSAGDLKQIIFGDFELIEKFISKQIIDYIVSIFFIFIFGVGLFKISIPLTFVCCAIIPLPYIAGIIIGKINYKRAKKKRELFGEYENFLHFSLQSWKEIKSLSLEKQQLYVFLDYRRKIAKYDIRSGYCDYIKEMVDFINESFLIKLSIYFFGGLLVMRGDFSIGSLLVFLNYYTIFYSKIIFISSSDYEFHSDLPSFSKIINILSDKKEEEIQNSFNNGDISFNNVSFRYSATSQFMLDHISFSIKQGEKVAFVGKSGSGKSTIVKLLLKIHSPLEGSIYINGENIEHINDKLLRKNIKSIMQESILFNISIKENLLLIKPDASENQIINACKMVHLNDFIEQLPDKYNTIIGEKGVQLSGGQKQCLNLARLLLSMPEIIVLDEAMSALDSKMAENVQKEIMDAAENKTVIIITHKLTSVFNLDKIFVIDDGKIAAIGTHRELLSGCDVYIKLYNEQILDYKNVGNE